jgi:hypothetical protein
VDGQHLRLFYAIQQFEKWGKKRTLKFTADGDFLCNKAVLTAIVPRDTIRGTLCTIPMRNEIARKQRSAAAL